MDKELLKEILEYIEYAEFSNDDEYGSGRDVETLIKENKMPELYYKLKKLL